MPTIDPTAGGHAEDGTESGYTRVKPISCDLARVPFRANSFKGEGGTSGTAVYQYSGILENEDGTGTGLTLTVPAGLDSGVRVWFRFRGPVLGLRIRQDSTATATPEFSVWIDGVTHGPYDARPLRLLNEGLTTAIHSAPIIVRDDLDPYEHTSNVTVASDPSVSRTLVINGLLLARSAGYNDPPRCLHTTGAGVAVLTASFASVLSSTSTLLGVRSIQYTNTSGSPVSVYVGLTASEAQRYELAAAGTDGDSKTIDFGGIWAVGTILVHKASSAAAVNWVALGGY